jgi:hypothetical protein
MHIKTKQIEPLGFKGSGMYDHAASYNHYYRKDKKNSCIIGVTQLYPPTVFSFPLTKKQFTEFEAGKLSLVPPGCCNASGGKHIDHDKCTVHHEGEIKNMRHLKEILEQVEAFYQAL